MGSCAGQIELDENANPELLLGRDVYRQNCSSCHGPTGGGAIGPSLRQIETRLELDAQREIVVNGREGMPRFASKLSDEEIDAVVRLVREVL